MATPPTESLADRVRRLRESSSDWEDEDSQVTVVAQPGSTVNVGKPDSDGPLHGRPKWARTLIAIVSALAGAAGMAKAIWEATKK